MSGLADSKANILISINGIIISVLLATISPRISASPWLLLPTTVVLVSSLVSISFAIVAARPRVSGPAPTDPSQANLMFFGGFVSLSPEEYERGVLDLLQSRDRLYRTMIRDIYGLGKVLERKFGLLRKAYSIFLVGLITGVVLFLGVYAWMVLCPPPIRPLPTF